MRNHRFRLLLPLALLVAVATAAPALAARSIAMRGCNATAAARVVEATNQYRESLGLSQLKVVPKLSAFAVAHARDMAVNATLTHSSSSGESFAERAHGSGYRFTSMRENVALEGAPLPASLGPDIWTLWRRSPAHDANMRALDVTEIGVAVAPGRYGCYASMELGNPLR
ncbi:MAG: hypothetical protein QOJ52_4386 [Acidimicrobiaceae bacterium]|nr:hypothetical protein [Acidimicrobiaceae bacterium]